jgi:uncharacterized protein
MVQRQHVEFAAEGGVTLRGWLLIPDGPPPHPAITMAHGFAGVKEHGLDRFARVFTAAGFVVLVHDHRGFGATTARHATTSTRGSRSPTGAGQSPSWRANPS